MSVASGPAMQGSGLILCIDPSNINNLSVWPNNFYTNGSFQGGQGISQEFGSNPTNSIILFDNPGDSPYVLQQSNLGSQQYTEYQLDLSTQLVASSTYCMSGWYAQSANYSGDSRMFHARTFSSSGNNIATGVGIGTGIVSETINGIDWSYRYHTIDTPSDYSNAFNWYVGYGGDNYSGFRYYTNLRCDKGTFPALIDQSRNGHYTIANGPIGFNTSGAGCLTFDGSTTYLTIADSNALTSNDALTIDIWFYGTDVSSRFNDLVGKGSSDADEEYCVSAGNGSIYFDVGNNTGPYTQPSYTFSNNTWYNITCIHSRVSGSSTLTVYVNGSALSGTTISPTNAVNNNSLPVSIGRRFYNSNPYGAAFNGRFGQLRMYNTALTASQILSNFNSMRGRYGI